jgi:ABC-type transport system involved in multi-copper enzyme maturation permease subunit
MNPIIARELLEVLRTRKALAMQLGLALVCALFVLVRWPTTGVADLSGVRSLRVLQVFGYGMLVSILLLVPAYPATSLVREKLQGTLALLLNSPMRPWSIYLGKLGGVLGFSAVLLLMTLPAAAACYALGGSETRGGISLLYGVLGVAVLQLATLGLLVSSRVQTADTALRFTYGLVLGVTILPLVPHALLHHGTDSASHLAAFFRCLSPIPAVMELLGHGDVGSSGMSAGSNAVTLYVLLALPLSLACALATIVTLNHKLLDRARPAGIMTQDRSLFQQIVRRVLFLVDPQRRSGSTSTWINPVLVKEFRSRRFGRSHWMLRLIALAAILSLGISCIALSGALDWGIEDIGGGLVLLQVVLLILFTPSLAAGLVSAERESGTWQLLRMTPLSPVTILVGKLVSVVWPLLLLFCATLPGYVVLMTIKPTLIPQVQRVILCLALMGVFAVLLSAAISTLFRSSARSTTAAYLSLLTICVGPLLLWLERETPFGHQTVTVGLTLSPVAAALQASGTTGFAQYQLLPTNWWIIGSACLVLIVFLGVQMWRLYRPE